MKLCSDQINISFPERTIVEGVFKNGKFVALKVTSESRRKDVVLMIE